MICVSDEDCREYCKHAKTEPESTVPSPSPRERSGPTVPFRPRIQRSNGQTRESKEEGRVDEAAGGSGSGPVARRAAAKVEKSGPPSIERTRTPVIDILPGPGTVPNAAAALGRLRLRLSGSVRLPLASSNPAPGTLPELRSESSTPEEPSAKVIAPTEPEPEGVDGRGDVEQGETPRSWVDVVNGPHTPIGRRNFLTHHPASTAQVVDELSRRVGTVPSMPRYDGLADRLHTVPSLAIRIYGLTCQVLDLPVHKWTAVQNLKDRAAEAFLQWLAEQGLELDDHVRQSIAVRFEKIHQGGPTGGTQVYIEVILPASEFRDSLIRNCRRPFSIRSGHRSVVIESHPVHGTRWELPLPPQSTATFLALAAAIGVKEGDYASVAALASCLIQDSEEAGVRDVYVRAQHPAGGGRSALKLSMCVNIGDLPDMTAHICVAGADILMPQLCLKDTREITRCLVNQRQICESPTSRHLIIWLPPMMWRNRADAMERDRSIVKFLEETFHGCKATILKEREHCAHGVLFSLPTEEGANRMLEDSSDLLRKHSALREVWKDTEPLPCIRIAGPPRCLQMLTPSQLATLAPRYDWSHQLPRPRDQAPRIAPAPPPRAPGLRPGPGPDNPKRTATPTHTW